MFNHCQESVHTGTGWQLKVLVCQSLSYCAPFGSVCGCEPVRAASHSATEVGTLHKATLVIPRLGAILQGSVNRRHRWNQHASLCVNEFNSTVGCKLVCVFYAYNRWSLRCHRARHCTLKPSVLHAYVCASSLLCCSFSSPAAVSM